MSTSTAPTTATTAATASAAAATAESGSVHDDFLRMFKEEGLEELAMEVGIMRNGEIPALKEYVTEQQSRDSTGAERFLEHQPRDSESKLGDQHDESGEGGGFNNRDSRTFDERQLSHQLDLAKSANKGLRHSSMKVLRKVEEKGRTTYNEVADELVAEYTGQRTSRPGEDDEGKNIRRRVYDILNVLIAMEIITKEKKDIRWRGLPSNAEKDMEVLERKRKASLKSISEKKQHLQDLLMQQLALQNLIRRNQTTATQHVPVGQRIPLPFIVVNSNKETVIECEMADDRTDVFFNFSQPFEIHDDNEVLKRMKLQHAPVDGSKLSDSIPESLLPYLPEHVRNSEVASTANDVVSKLNTAEHNGSIAEPTPGPSQTAQDTSAK